MKIKLNHLVMVYGLLFILIPMTLKAETLDLKSVPGLLMKPEVRQLLEQQRTRHFLPVAVPVLDEEEIELSEVRGQLRLSAIINASGSRQAIINGQVFNEREEKEGIHVHRIFPSHVTLTTLGQWGRAELGIVYELSSWPEKPSNKITVGP
ncbi:hypothetical protein JX580_03915 [Thiomicrospira microaerophila]|uniref:hypothetical protein n=1 Tax=Thiomicrospira microaerophila TaxID=406020 RepID=UPI0020104D1E|nr:hypothetical protein [Thiomicrospira microaerophila]UQB43037.1 hypothetical protein JX580_03915 [Thiomicrospira microaerophila]